MPLVYSETQLPLGEYNTESFTHPANFIRTHRIQNLVNATYDDRFAGMCAYKVGFRYGFDVMCWGMVFDVFKVWGGSSSVPLYPTYWTEN